ncbi:MAG: dienelactone hydrolase family protein [Halioglobus sp.]|nr:dienelactone hydrolase family protein [Halioglobus sp.]
MTAPPTPVSKYSKTRFTAPGGNGPEISHDIYRLGSGAPVVIIQELPGIGPQTLHLADAFVARGFEVILPHLFGPLGKISMGGNLLRVFCMRREFSLFEANRSSPIVDWLRALCRDIRAQGDHPGVGVIGMCLTGNFAISLMGDDSVLAAVSSQPSMPLMKASELHMSADEIEGVRRRIDSTAPMHAYRFAGDPLCNAQKFEAIDKAFNDSDNTRIVNHTLPGKGHSVLTIDFVDEQGHPTREALDSILSYFSAQLQ